MKKISLLFTLTLLSHFIFAQKFDYHWTLTLDYTQKNSLFLNFNTNPASILEKQTSSNRVYGCSSDANGNLIFIFSDNGIQSSDLKQLIKINHSANEEILYNACIPLPSLNQKYIILYKRLDPH